MQYMVITGQQPRCYSGRCLRHGHAGIYNQYPTFGMGCGAAGQKGCLSRELPVSASSSFCYSMV